MRLSSGWRRFGVWLFLVSVAAGTWLRAAVDSAAPIPDALARKPGRLGKRHAAPAT